MQRSTLVRTGAIGALCALAGGAAGIGGTSASSSEAVRMPLSAGEPGLLWKAGPITDAAGPPVHPTRLCQTRAAASKR